MIKMNGSALSSGQRSDGNFQAIPKARGGDSDINLENFIRRCCIFFQPFQLPPVLVFMTPHKLVVGYGSFPRRHLARQGK